MDKIRKQILDNIQCKVTGVVEVINDNYDVKIDMSNGKVKYTTITKDDFQIPIKVLIGSVRFELLYKHYKVNNPPLYESLKDIYNKVRNISFSGSQLHQVVESTIGVIKLRKRGNSFAVESIESDNTDNIILIKLLFQHLDYLKNK